MDSQDTYSLVQKSYEQIANNRDAADNQGPSYEESVAMAFGYSVDELRSIPEKANLGLSCGNPLATANLKQGETVIDLGSGGGLDVLLAAEKVGAEGKAIGVDMTKKMLDLAHRNIEKAGVKNASFIEASITSIPLPDATADCIISNCVINLVPEAEKHLVFKEMYRLLKPGGRAVFSDILARKELTKEIKENLALYVGCIAGASQVSEYQTYLGDAGFEGILILDAKSNLNLYKDLLQPQAGQQNCAAATPCCGSEPAMVEVTSTSQNILDLDFNDWAGSYQVCAVKSAA